MGTNPFWQDDQRVQNERMVEAQLLPRGIADGPTLNAMRRVPRHLFVPPGMRDQAYEDNALSIGYGQTISQPFIVAFATQALGLEKSDVVLEVGTGSGYQAAVLGQVAASVYSVEIIELLGIRAKNTLKSLGYDNIFIRTGDGYNGWHEHGPYDAVMVTAGTDKIPPPLLDQLRTGGRMILPLGAYRSVRQLVLVQKEEGILKQTPLLPVRFVPLTRSGTREG